MCVRDEADIIEAQIAFHRAVGVEIVVVTDTGSTDGTFEILERLRDDGGVDLMRDLSRPARAMHLQTKMARRAATVHGADWVIVSDADEFWWPRASSVKRVLGTIPERYGAVRGVWRSFVPRPEDERPFFERMTLRLDSSIGPINDPLNPFRTNTKIAHRGHSQVEIGYGGQGPTLVNPPLVTLRGWYPFEVLHFPVRSRAQARRKYANANERADPTGSNDQSGDPFSEFVINDADVEAGLAAGAITEDTRLRDALLRLATFDLAAPGLIELEPPSVVDDAGFAVEIAVLGEAMLVRTQRRLDDIDVRLRAIERLPLLKAEHRVRQLVRRWRRG
jgi:hypothetical protein